MFNYVLFLKMLFSFSNAPPIPIPGVSQGSLSGATNMEQMLFGSFLCFLEAFFKICPCPHQSAPD